MVRTDEAPAALVLMCYFNPPHEWWIEFPKRAGDLDLGDVIARQPTSPPPTVATIKMSSKAASRRGPQP